MSTLIDGILALDIGLQVRSKSCYTLATLGRGEADVFVEGSSIAKIQCSFEIDPDTSVIMFYDRSHGQTTQVFGENATPFEHGRLRRVVVHEGRNKVIGMGGVGKDLVLFELKWHQDLVSTMSKVKNGDGVAQGYKENPRLARTVDESETVLPSRRETRPHTPGPRQLDVRYSKVAMLGAGQFGTVHKAINMDTGKFMAVKILRPRTQEEAWKQSSHYALKREVEILSQISHPYIVDYIASQGWDGPQVEIFMGLKEGTLQSLVENWTLPSITNLAHFVIHQMLQALDCLAWNGIVHRDVKPENILYQSLPGAQYQFQLGDFGLCNRAISAVTVVGSPLYMAPEMFQKGGQTHKADVWSLFVTILWVLNKDFRQKSEQFQTTEEVHETVLTAASSIKIIQEMARMNPNDRASAAQMLIKCFNGEGLTTPQNQVPAICPAKVETNTSHEVRFAPTRHANRNFRGLRTDSKGRCGVHRLRVPAGPKHQYNVAGKHPGPAKIRPVRGCRMPGRFPDDDTNSPG